MMRALLIAAALFSANGSDDATQQQRLDAARAKWAQAAVPDYRFTVRRGCFCPEPYTSPYDMYVRGGKPYEPVKYVKTYGSVDQLFAIIQDGIDGDGTVGATYGADGVPESIALDPLPNAVDDETAITVSNFEKGFFSVPDVSIRDGSARDRLVAARRRWRRTGLEDYRYEVRYSCFCANTDPFTVTVRYRKAVGRGPTVLALFRNIGRAIRQGSARLDVKYADSGRPVSIYDDRDELTADEELGTTTTKPVPLEVRRSAARTSVDPSAQADLDAARARWAEEGLGDYRFKVSRSCFCPREYTRTYMVRVRDGKPVEPVKYVKDLASVPRLFRVIQQGIDQDYDGLSVTYGDRGVPTTIGLDPEREATDEESSISVRKLRALA